MSNVLELPSILDLIAAPVLHEAFTGRRGTALAVDASGVRRLGAQCLQVLLAARAAWAADGMTLAMDHLSDEFTATLELLGAAREDLTHDAQQDVATLDGKELAA